MFQEEEHREAGKEATIEQVSTQRSSFTCASAACLSASASASAFAGSKGSHVKREH
jgi:hypothetical protein